MNYDEFRAWRDDLVRMEPALRLDCMNPAKALGHLVGTTDGPTTVPASPTALLSRWKKVLGMEIDSDRLVLGEGIRDLLRALFASLTPKDGTFWLPRDVYPVYWELAKQRRLASFTTVPAIDWSFLSRTSPNDGLLLPSPLSPTGRQLTACESDALVTWLNDSPNRLLVFDRVYNYSFPICNEGLRSLATHAQCCSIFSTSKAWLLTQTAGIAIVPAVLSADVRRHATIPSKIQRATAMERFSWEQDLPAKLQRRFDQQWLKLQPQIERIDATWKPPETGYFSMIEIPNGELWDEYRVVGVPASVFGSAEKVSIITCLFDIKADDLGKR